MGLCRVLSTEVGRISFVFSRQTFTINSTSLSPLSKYHVNLWHSWKLEERLNTITLRRFYSQNEKSKSVTEIKSENVPSTSFQQVKEATKTVSYLGIIVIGLGVTGVMMYAVFHELFSSKSPNNIYTSALERCCSEPRVLNVLGEPIKGYGEETRRGRRRHTSHVFYQKDGINMIRMKFYIQGSRRRGTVHLEMKEDASGRFVYRYLIVKMDDYPPSTIVLEDHRIDESVENRLPNLL